LVPVWHLTPATYIELAVAANQAVAVLA
jgi:hypothetical protein